MTRRDIPAAGQKRVTTASASAHPGDEPMTVDTTDSPTGSPSGPATDIGTGRSSTVVGTIGPIDPTGRQSIEVVVDGWRFQLLVEDETRASLRERATRDRPASGTAGGPLEIRAIIPGRVVGMAVAPGDTVEAGQTLLAVEAMKMQNELRAPRAGTVTRVPAATGATVEVGDVLVVLE